MLAKIVAFSPEMFLILALPLMGLISRYRSSKTAKTFYSISKIMLLLSMLATIVFYNRSPFPLLMQNNTYTTLYKIFIELLAFGTFFLSCKWFLNKNRSSAMYYALGLGVILSLNVMISTVHFGILVGGYFVASLLQYFMLKLGAEDYEYEEGGFRYFAFMFLFSVIMLMSALWFHAQTGSWNYEVIAKYYAKHAWNIKDIMAFAGILLPLLFMMGIAPLHFCKIELSGLSILPVCMLNNLLPLVASYAVLLCLLTDVFASMQAIYLPFLQIVAIISLLWGAISAIKEENLRRMFGYCGVYSLGFIILGILPFSNNGITSSFVYLVSYLLTMWGVYTVFFAFKSNGEYLSSISDISGVFAQKPYVSVLLTVFIVSMAGSPPMLIFLGKLQVIDNMMINHAYAEVVVAMLALLLLINAFFKMIRTMFFEPRSKIFDHADRGIYFCLFVNMIFFLIGMLNPALFIERFELLLKPIMR